MATPWRLQKRRSGRREVGNDAGSTDFVWMTGIEEFHKEITSRNYKYLRPGIETTFYVAKCVEVIDPFGNRIRFNEDQKTSEAK